MKKQMLYFDNYLITDINIRLNTEFIKPEGPINVDPSFSKKIDKIDDNQAIVRIKINIDKHVNKPFYGSIVIQGSFTCENYESSEDGTYLMNKTTLSILYPYLRQALSNITTLLNVPTYVLPIVNIIDLFYKEN